jgi:phage replication initiation protein
MEGGKMGYSCMLRRENIVIYHSSDLTKVCLELSGKGCRQIERERLVPVETGWSGFFGQLLEMGGSFCRVDFALDDTSNLLDLDVMIQAVHDGLCVSRLIHCKPHDDLRLANGKREGRGIQFGSRSSSYCVRVYDKSLEQMARRKAETDVAGIRVEIEAKKKMSDALVRAFISDGPIAINRDLHARLRFVEMPMGRDTNRARWPECEWWIDFLDRCGHARVRMAQKTRTLADIAAAFEMQWGPWLACLMQSPAFGKCWLNGVVERGCARITEKHHDFQEAGLPDNTNKAVSAFPIN